MSLENSIVDSNADMMSVVSGAGSKDRYKQLHPTEAV